jgi:hypothetical protein
MTAVFPFIPEIIKGNGIIVRIVIPFPEISLPLVVSIATNIIIPVV